MNRITLGKKKHKWNGKVTFICFDKMFLLISHVSNLASEDTAVDQTH